MTILLTLAMVSVFASAYPPVPGPPATGPADARYLYCRDGETPEMWFDLSHSERSLVPNTVLHSPAIWQKRNWPTFYSDYVYPRFDVSSKVDAQGTVQMAFHWWAPYEGWALGKAEITTKDYITGTGHLAVVGLSRTWQYDLSCQFFSDFDDYISLKPRLYSCTSGSDSFWFSTIDSNDYRGMRSTLGEDFSQAELFPTWHYDSIFKHDYVGYKGPVVVDRVITNRFYATEKLAWSSSKESIVVHEFNQETPPKSVGERTREWQCLKLNPDSKKDSRILDIEVGI